MAAAAALVELLQRPWVAAAQLQACAILLVGVVGWTWSGLRRGREAARLAAAGCAVAAAAAQQESAAADGRKTGRAHKQAQQLELTACSAQQQRCPPPGRTTARLFKSATARQAAEGARAWPPLALVCPVKGCRPHSSTNWHALLAAQYGGPRVCVFVVESASDPAAAVLAELAQQAGLAAQQPVQQQCQQQGGSGGRVLAAWQQRPGQQQLLLVEARRATTCSQKIHNILAGIEAALLALQQQQQQQQQQPPPHGPSGGYVCMLDDDVMLHPLSLMQLVDEMEAAPALFMTTGYPYDVVATRPSSCSNGGGGGWLGRLLVHAAASYHLPLLIGFSVAGTGSFVWGGAMMLRADYLAAGLAAAGAVCDDGTQAAGDPTGSSCACQQQQQQQPPPQHILQVWRQGGYSDDLLLAGFCAAQGLPIGLPAAGLFPQLLPHSITWPDYWNYLRRQLYVLDTYYSDHNRRVNHAMMAAHSYGSAVFAAGVCAAAAQLLLAAVGVATAAGAQLAERLASRQLLSLWAYSMLCGSSRCGDASSGLQQQLAARVGRCTTRSTWLLVGCGLAAHCSVAFMHRHVLALFRQLSPHAGRDVLAPRVAWSLLWAGWLLSNAILPWCMLYTYVTDTISWGGIRYHKHGGKVVRVVHPP